VIRIENVSKSFGRKCVVDQVSFSLSRREIVGLVGPSGGGKTVLLKLLGGVLKPDSGAILGENGEHFPSVGFSFQEGALFDSMTVLENVAFPLLSRRLNKARSKDAPLVSTEEAFERAFQILQEVGLSRDGEKVPGQLSGGMRRRVGIARALVARPELVLLDDPTGGLDPVAASVIMDLVADLHSHYAPTVVMVSHDIRRLLPRVDRVLGLFGGAICCDEKRDSLVERADPKVVAFLSTRFDFGPRAIH